MVQHRFTMKKRESLCLIIASMLIALTLSQTTQSNLGTTASTSNGTGTTASPITSSGINTTQSNVGTTPSTSNETGTIASPITSSGITTTQSNVGTTPSTSNETGTTASPITSSGINTTQSNVGTTPSTSNETGTTASPITSSGINTTQSNVGTTPSTSNETRTTASPITSSGINTTSGPTNGSTVTPPPVASVQGEGEIMVMSQEFHLKLGDPTSVEFKHLEGLLVQEITTQIASETGGYLDVSVKQFRPGSVIAVVQLGTSNHIYQNLAWTKLKTIVKTGIMGKFLLDPGYFIRRQGNSSCQPPSVIMLDLNNDYNIARIVKLKRSDSMIVHTSVKLNCSEGKEAKFEWTVRNNNSQVVEYLDGTAEWTIEKRSLPFGILYVEFQVSMVGFPYARAIDAGFLHVVETPLVVEIAGGSEVARGYSRNITFDASPTEDPDVGPGNYSAMVFTWMCKKKNEVFPEHVPVVTPPSAGSNPRLGGCFGTGVGRLASQGLKVYIDTRYMNLGDVYTIKLQVTKGLRNGTFEQFLKIVQGDPPVLTIKCLINCGTQVSVTNRLSLTTACTGSAACISESLRYSWTLKKHTAQQTLELVPDLANIISTKLDSPGIVLEKVNSLESNVKYRLLVTTQADGVAEGVASYDFTTNSPPSGGTCNVSPTVGTALETEFRFTCSGWQDQNKPITYEFHYETDKGLYTVVSYGLKAEAVTKLPVGKASESFKLKFEAVIIDSLSAATKRAVNVKVKAPPTGSAGTLNKTLTGLIVGGNSQLEQLITSGDVRQATQLANAVLGTIKASDEAAMTVDDKKKIKESIVDNMAQVRVDNLQTLTQVSSVLGRATENTKELSLVSQNKSLDALKKMTSLMASKSREDGGAESSLINACGDNLVFSLGNVLRASSKSAEVTKSSIGGDISDNKKESKTIADDSVKLVDNVGKALLSRKVVGETPTLIKTASLSMVLDRQRPRDLNMSKIKEGKSSFKLPSVDDLLQDKGDTFEFIDSQMLSSEFNPFTWDVSAQRVQSQVISLQLRNHQGSKIAISNLKRNIKITIPRTPSENATNSTQKFFIKPSVDGKMQFHSFVVEQQNTSAVVQIVMNSSVVFAVYVRFETRPNTNDYDFKTEVPNYSTCLTLNDREHVHCTQDPLSIYLSPQILRNTGKYYIGILFELNNQKVKKSRKRRSCKFELEGKRQRRSSCVEPKDPPWPKNITEIPPVYDSKTDVNYTMGISQYSCLYWSKSKQRWSTAGCQAGFKSSRYSLHCLCNHLTSFGGGLLVEPNPIDFATVLVELKRLGETGNVAVLTAILVALLLYLIVAVFARRSDKRDAKKFGPPILLTVADGATHEYQLIVGTGVWRGSGTTASVTIVIHGSEGESEPIVIHRHMIPGRLLLMRGNDDSFNLHLPISLGTIQFLHIRHDNSGKSPAWFLRHIFLKKQESGEKFTFICNQWFGLSKDDGKIERIITAASLYDLQSFNYTFNNKASNNLAEGHLWLSVVMKPSRSHFTRVQRATCCLTLLLSAMLANAMFYGIKPTAEPTIQIGPLKFSWKQIIIGIESCLIVTPINLLIVYLFKNSKPKSSSEPRHRNKSESSKRFCKSEAFSSCFCCPRSKSNFKQLECNTEEFSEQKEKKSLTSCFSGFSFSHWFKCIAWLLCFLTIATSASITFSYSLQWGKTISNEWLSSMLISFTEDLFVLQPVKVCLITIALAFIMANRKTDEIDSTQISNSDRNDNNAESAIHSLSAPANPIGKDLEAAREFATKERKMFTIVKDTIGYLIFLTLLTIVCYGTRTKYGYLMSKAVKESTPKFSKVTNSVNFWKWVDSKLTSGVFAGTWYNGLVESQEVYIGNKKSILIGMPHFRQLRVKEGSCKVPLKARKIFPHCHGQYSFSDEDTTPFSLPGWKPFSPFNAANITTLCPKAWRYVTPKAHGSLPIWGYFTVYNGGGYVADLGYNAKTARRVVSDLRANNWIDQRTRVVLIEFSIFNANTNYLSICTMFFEVLPTGHGYAFERTETFPLYNKQTGFYEFYLICQLLFILMVLYYAVLECFKLYRQRCAYFANIWNWIELVQLTCALLAILFYIIKAKSVLASITKLQANPYVSVNFQKAFAWSDAENIVLSITVFVITIKLLNMFRFNPHISIFSSSMRVARKFLVSYSVLLFIIYSSYGMLAYLVLGGNIFQYSTFTRTLEQEFIMTLGGKMQLESLRRVNRILGPLIGFSFKIWILFIFLNFFVVILNDSYEDVKANTDKQSKEFEMADFIQMRFKAIFFKSISYERVSPVSNEIKDRENTSHKEDIATPRNSLTSSETHDQDKPDTATVTITDVTSATTEKNETETLLASDKTVPAEDLTLCNSQLEKPPISANNLGNTSISPNHHHRVHKAVSGQRGRKYKLLRPCTKSKATVKRSTRLAQHGTHSTMDLSRTLKICSEIESKETRVTELLELAVLDFLDEDMEMINLILTMLVSSSNSSGQENQEPLNPGELLITEEPEPNSDVRGKSLQNLKMFLKEENLELKEMFRCKVTGMLPAHLRFRYLKTALLKRLQSS